MNGHALNTIFELEDIELGQSDFE